MANFLLGLVVMGAGGAIVYFSAVLSITIGRSAWAEKYVGSTRNGVILFGFIVIVIGVLTVFGMFDGMQGVT